MRGLAPAQLPCAIFSGGNVAVSTDGVTAEGLAVQQQRAPVGVHVISVVAVVTNWPVASCCCCGVLTLVNGVQDVVRLAANTTPFSPRKKRAKSVSTKSIKRVVQNTNI